MARRSTLEVSPKTEVVVNEQNRNPDVDVVVVGAGVAGLYLLHRLREMGLAAQAFETGDDVGGTWYWNRYPGARCDVQSIDYSYSWDTELDETWEWSERYATQPEILRYLNFVADKHDLRRDIRFSTRVERAVWNDETALWEVTTDDGVTTTCRYHVMATGCLSVMKDPDVEGAGTFGGEVYFTGRWPHEGVDFTGKRVAVIGTGSSAIQSIPLIAAQADQLTVFQRTPNFSLPAYNGPVRDHDAEKIRADRAAYREEARWSSSGVPRELVEESALAVSEEVRQERYEKAWNEGTIFSLLGAFNDILTNRDANATAAEFVRGKIRSIVDDPETAEALSPRTYPVGTKRLCLDSGYYATFNEDHVSLVDLRKNPIASITETGIDVVTGEGATSYEFDAIVYATGFDAMTGAIVSVDIAGRDGVELRDRWADGPHTYLGLMSSGFPNLFMVTGPQSPSVLSNMAVSIEQHVDWICDTIDHLRENGKTVIEPTVTAEAGWVQHTNDYADITLFPEANSWYMGANVPGKPRVVLPYVGGVDRYRQTCDAVVEQGYLGFELSGDDGTEVTDGVICRVQPDVAIMLELMDELGLPSMDTMSPDDARAMSEAMGAQSPPGPEVGEVVDGTLPGADGNDLDYRLYRPATPGPHPVAAYFHGGGWVLGNATSDDALCRDLCDRSGVMVISVDYRHAPEARFPAAPDDGFAAVSWIADHAEELGAVPGQLAVAGWSAGANIAAVVAQRARDEGGPRISGQLLLTPVTDCDTTRPSYIDNGDGYILTAALMSWFWDHYAEPSDRSDPRASPLRADSLAGLPPAMIVTCEFDPLRDEGDAYADALSAAGVDVNHVQARGQIHTAIPAVGALLSGVDIRGEMASSLSGFFGASVPA
ncbi:flavin-containing monooxygenase [Ilumatobacter nonamiensis]|uniref:flavin-containing monooxygenase n=1 Tax=Ilumatobacter nonamiensis TaxID=467093 RepID=UPI000A045577